jgi:hypothetical protein
VDQGKKDGLLPGMQLHVTKPDSVYKEVKLTKVEETQSEGEFVFYLRQETPSLFSFLFKEPAPAKGWQLSTCPRWRRDKDELDELAKKEEPVKEKRGSSIFNILPRPW